MAPRTLVKGGVPTLRWWSRLGLFVAVSLATRALSLALDVIDMDEASYAAGARELLRGGTLYVDFADHKPPLVYAYYALCQALLGDGLIAVRIVTVLAVVPLTALALSAFFRHDRRGTLAALLYLVYGAAFIGHDMLAVNGELLLLLPASWALVLGRDEARAQHLGQGAAAGALLGIAFLFKYQAVLWLPALLAAAIVALPRPLRIGTVLRAAVALCAGFAAPLLVAWGHFAWGRAAADFLYWNVTHNLHYAANPIPMSEAMGRAASYLLPFLIVTAWLWWGLWKSWPALSRYQRVLIAGVLLGSGAAAFLGLRFYPHYFVQLYAPLALGCAPWAASLVDPPLRRVAKIAVTSTLVVFIGFTVATAVLYYGPGDVYEETNPVFERVASRLRADDCFAGGRLFVWGFAPILYYRTELRPASRFVFPDSTLVGYVPGNAASARFDSTRSGLVRPEHWDQLMADLATKRATYFVDTALSGLHGWHAYPVERFPRLRELLRREYVFLDAVDLVSIYKRRGCEAGR